MAQHCWNRLAVLVLLTPACSPDTHRDPSARTQRQRDSVIGASSLPGAGGVRGALGANDSTAARNARLDSIANQP
jgi:hypothetical protein